MSAFSVLALGLPLSSSPSTLLKASNQVSAPHLKRPSTCPHPQSLALTLTFQSASPPRQGVRGYVALNVLVFDEELPELEALVRVVAAAGVDALIVQVGSPFLSWKGMVQGGGSVCSQRLSSTRRLPDNRRHTIMPDGLCLIFDTGPWGSGACAARGTRPAHPWLYPDEHHECAGRRGECVWA